MLALPTNVIALIVGKTGLSMYNMPLAATMGLPNCDHNLELLLANLLYRLSCNSTGMLMSEKSTLIANWLTIETVAIKMRQ